MKTFKAITTLLLTGIVVIIMSQSSVAQVKPGTALSEAQIEAKLKAYYSGNASHVQVPETVNAAFKSHFSSTYDVEWKFSNGVYEVEFDKGTKDYEAWYDERGNLLAYKYDISTSSIPAVVKKAIKAKYPGYRIDDAEKYLKAQSVMYNISIEKGDHDLKVRYKEDGTFIQERAD